MRIRKEASNYIQRVIDINRRRHSRNWNKGSASFFGLEGAVSPLTTWPYLFLYTLFLKGLECNPGREENTKRAARISVKFPNANIAGCQLEYP